MNKPEPKHMWRGLAYTSNDDGGVAVSLDGDGLFNSYPETLRARVRLSMVLGHKTEEADKLYAAWDKSPKHYLAALDEVLCARAEALLEADAEIARANARFGKNRERER